METLAGVLGAELGTEPWRPLFWLQLFGVAVWLCYTPRTFFSQEKALLGSVGSFRFLMLEAGQMVACMLGSNSSSAKAGTAVRWRIWSIISMAS